MAILPNKPFLNNGLPLNETASGLRAEPSRYRITTIATLAQAGRWRMEAMRALTQPCLYWLTRGHGRITIGGLRRGYGAQMAIFLPSGVMHGLEIGAQTQGQVLFFGSDPALALPQTPWARLIREPAARSEITALLDTLACEAAQERPAAERAARSYLGLVSVWLERQMALAPPDALSIKAGNRLVNRFTALLESHFSENVSVSDYARQLRVTPTHLSRACRDACGRPASDLLAERRLYEARRLLKDTQLPIKEIAACLGFRSQTYFSRSFLAQTGITPSQFRQTKI